MDSSTGTRSSSNASSILGINSPLGSYIGRGPDDLFPVESEALITDMSRQAYQQRLYIINRAGTGEAQYVLLNQKRTDIESYGVRFETWKVIKGISNFGVAVVNNVLYVIGGYEIKNCKHLHRVVK